MPEKPKRTAQVWGVQLIPSDLGDRIIYAVATRSFSEAKAESPSAPLFATKESVREAIEQYGLHGHPAGIIEVAVDQKSKVLTGKFATGFLFQDKGLSAFVESQLERDLLKRFPGFSYWPPLRGTPSRKKMLARTQLDPHKPVPLKLDVQLLRDYVASRFWGFHHTRDERHYFKTRARKTRPFRWSDAKWLRAIRRKVK